MDRNKIIIRIIDEPETYKMDSSLLFINYKIITELLMNLDWKFKKIKKNQIEFIRFLNIYNSWELIGINTPDINVTNQKTLEFMVKLFKKDNQDEKIELMSNKAKNILSSIEKEIFELKDLQLYTKSSSIKLNISKQQSRTSSVNLAFDSSFSEQNYSFFDDKIVDIIVLTANPLVFLDQSNEHKELRELRVVNEFNSITDSIHQAVSKSNLPINSLFLTLTKHNLKYALFKKPKIIHLICKSTYEVDISIEKTYSPILLFENEKCGIDKITKNILSKIYLSYVNNLKEISLFISTPLCEDVFNMIKSKSDHKFKNILVQHTTLADISYISEFNRELYLNLLDKQTFEEAFNSAKSENVSGYQFCCCYHTHQDNCIIKMNLSNELFRPGEELIEHGSKEPLKMIPHFCHLRYQCNCKKNTNKNENDFCAHRSNCKETKNFLNKKNKKANNICCCVSETLKPKHNLNDIFKLYSSEDNKGIFADYEYDEYKKCIVIDSDKLPNYRKMLFKVGLNNIFYNVFEFITQNDYHIINFNGNQYNAIEIDNIIEILIEFIKERNSYFLIDSQKISLVNNDSGKSLNLSKNEMTEKLSDNSINKNNRLKLSKITSGINLDLEPNFQNSAKQLHIRENFIKPLPYFSILSQDSFHSSFIKEHQNNNIYIINALKISDLENKLKVFKDNTQANIIIFSTKKIVNIGNNKITNISFNILDDFDIKIKNQMYKIEHDKASFEELLKEKVLYLEEKELNEIKDLIEERSKKNEMYKLILYLFNCTNSGLFKFEFEGLFSNQEELNSAIKIRDEYIEKKIINVETNRGKTQKSFQQYTKYIKNKNVSNKIFDWIRIPDNIKYDILERLFFFYAKKFRFLLDKLRDGEIAEKNETEYEPHNTLFSFSAIQNLGIWLSLNDPNKYYDNETAPIYNEMGYFQHLNRNFHDIFNKINIEFCVQNQVVWEKVRDCLDDISITLLTLYKIFNNRQIEESISTFQDYFKMDNIEKYKFSKAAKLRFELFVKMQGVYDKNNKEKILKDLEKIEKGFSEINNKEGQLETLYAEIIMNNDNILINLIDIYEKKMEGLLEEMENEKGNMKFVSLFKSKINFKLIESKIDKKQYKLSDEYKNLIRIFIKNGMKYYVIETFLLITHHFDKIIKDKINEYESKFEKLHYLNCAYMYSLYLTSCNSKYSKYINYVKRKGKNTYSLSESLDSQRPEYKKIKDEMIKTFQKCGLNTSILENNSRNYFY